jgi:hypothetical protein
MWDVASLPLFDEERVLHRARGVAPEADAEEDRTSRTGAQILHRHRLSAGEVHRAGDVDVAGCSRTPTRSIHARQLADVDVAFERMLECRIVAFVDDDVDELPTLQS